LDGISFTYYNNGKVKSKISYKSGELHGDAITFSQNGNIKQKVRYSKSLKEGKHVNYHENGSISEKSNYKLDKLNGYFTSYNNEGFIKDKVEYKNGKKHGTSISYDYIPINKKHYKTEEGKYKDGSKNGLFKYYDFYYDNKNETLGSKLILTGSEMFKDDKLHGKWLDFDPEEGFLLIETNYTNDIENGIRKSYCPHGQDKGKLYVVHEYINGRGQDRTYYCDCPFPD
jgi:antitoxin component YwqK of YwqJK toxin-antitoxin module